MAKRIGRYDAILLGMIAGLLIGFPSIASSIGSWIEGMIPSDWLVLGDY